MATTGSYNVSTAHQDRNAEVARLAAQARLGWTKEVAVLERFGFRDGMSIVELGSGPGFVTELLLDHFPNAHVTAVERDRTLVDEASRYLAKHAGRVTFINASVDATGLPADAYDAAYARLLFQHLPDPAFPLAEILRFLRPGAPFVVYDIDDKIVGVSDPEIPGFDAIVQRIAKAKAGQGGNRYIGRLLLRILKRAGFEELDLEAIAVNSETEGLDRFMHQFDPGRLVPMVQMGVLSQAETDELIAKRADFLASDPFVVFLSLMAKGRKPEVARAG